MPRKNQVLHLVQPIDTFPSLLISLLTSLWQMMLMMTLSLWYRRLPVLSCGNHNLWTLLTSFLSLGQLASHSQLAILRLALRGADRTRPQTDRVKFFYKAKVETRCILQYIFSDGQEPNTHKQKSTFSS